MLDRFYLFRVVDVRTGDIVSFGDRRDQNDVFANVGDDGFVFAIFGDRNDRRHDVVGDLHVSRARGQCMFSDRTRRWQ